MFPHHVETLRRTTDHFRQDPSVIALLLAGSLAHGFHSATSDIDLMIVVSDDDHRTRREQGATCFFSRELCTYPEGYIDGKYTSEAYLKEVRDRGSEPARFAFQNAQVLYSRNAALAPLVAEIAQYPLAEKSARLWRFQAQFEAWFWYCGEALKRDNLTLLRTAVGKLVLFGGRIVLAHNERLYPYHKWFLRVLAAAPEKPADLLAQIETLGRAPDRAAVDRFGETIRNFRAWQISHATWPAQFMADSENNWLHHPAPVDDI